MLDATILLLVVIAFLLAGCYANLCNNLLASGDEGDQSPFS